jgi:multidrug efflux pump subunit AcrA (membrane-fusion protein)
MGSRIGPGTEVLTVTSQVRSVTVRLPVTEQRVAVQDAAVTVRIPGGLESGGRIVSIGSPEEAPGDTDKKLVIPVEIALDRPDAAGDLQRISVTAMFQRTVYEKVLTVPVTALLALPGGGLGVEKRGKGGVDPEPVDVGAFVEGFVEITGGELAEGDQVVVPE